MPDLLGWWSLTAVVLVVIGWYLSYSAARLDRLHHKVESARAALDAQLVRRAAVSLEVAGALDPATGLMLAGAASESLGDGQTVAGIDGDGGAPLEEAENDLTRAIQAAFEDPEHVARLRQNPVTGDVLDALAEACTRVQLARRFHNDAVAQAQRVRRKRVVRWARLAGHAPSPPMIEIDDSLPPGLVT
ncbi:MAG: hypothetical protein GXX79_06195 [Actinomycetales bacterium]|nr:hypothetical protein [Actinomycetales bacterium]